MNLLILLLNAFRADQKIQDCLYEIIYWRITRAGNNSVPVRTSLGHESPEKDGDKSAVHQGRLTAARIAHHRNEAVISKLYEHFIHLPLANEEEMTLVQGKRPKSGKWIFRTYFAFHKHIS